MCTLFDLCKLQVRVLLQAREDEWIKWMRTVGSMLLVAFLISHIVIGFFGVILVPVIHPPVTNIAIDGSIRPGIHFFLSLVPHILVSPCSHSTFHTWPLCS